MPRVPPGSSGSGAPGVFLITGGGSTPGGLSLFSFDNSNFVVFAPLSRSLRFANGDEKIYFSQPQISHQNLHAPLSPGMGRKLTTSNEKVSNVFSKHFA